MRKLLFLSLAATLGLFFTACEPKQPEEPAITLQGIKLAPSSVTLEEGESVKLHVKYAPEEAKETAPKVLWYSDKQRVASVDEEGLVTADRTGTAVITATCGKFEATCTVNVSKKDLPGPDPSVSFSVSPKNIEAPAEGGTYEIVVKSNAEWTAELENSEWASLSATSGNGDATLTLTVEGTEEETPISQNITFTAGKGKYYVLVSRAGYKKEAQLTLDKTEEQLPVSGGSFTVNVQSELDWEATCDDKRVTLTKSGNSLNVTVSKFNLTREECKERFGASYSYRFYNDREEKGDKIPVVISNGEKSETFTIWQKYPYLCRKNAGYAPSSFGSVYYWNTRDAHTFTTTIESNIPWKVVFEYDDVERDGSGWASAIPMSGTGNATISVMFSANTSSDKSDSRTGYCRIIGDGGYTPIYCSGDGDNMIHEYREN